MRETSHRGGSRIGSEHAIEPRIREAVERLIDDQKPKRRPSRTEKAVQASLTPILTRKRTAQHQYTFLHLASSHLPTRGFDLMLEKGKAHLDRHHSSIAELFSAGRTRLRPPGSISLIPQPAQGASKIHYPDPINISKNHFYDRS
jgi:hypothetical protein